MARLYACFLESEHARILQLSHLIQVEGQVLQRKLRLVNLVDFSTLPRAEIDHLHGALLVNGVVTVPLEVKSYLVCQHVHRLSRKVVLDLRVGLAVIVSRALDNIDHDALPNGRIRRAPNLKICHIKTGVQVLELLYVDLLGFIDLKKVAAIMTSQAELFHAASMAVQFGPGLH